jgi:hypothetical protein
MGTAMNFKDQCLGKLQYNSITGIFTWISNGTRGVKKDDVAGYKSKAGYIMLSVSGRKILAHRVAWMFTYGDFPVGQIDHINRNKSDNRIENLREATFAQNAQNRVKNICNTSGYKGVTWHKRDQKWQAAVTIKGKCIYLGYFSSPENAYEAYKEASLKHQTHSIFKESI